MQINVKHIGRKVKEIRTAKGMSQEQLAEQIDISVPYMSRIETGSKNVSLPTLLRISVALGVRLDMLVDGSHTGDSVVHCCRFSILIGGCSDDEAQHIFDVALATKASLRKNIRRHP